MLEPVGELPVPTGTPRCGTAVRPAVTVLAADPAGSRQIVTILG
jgi:hypothetical protein